MTEEKYLTIFQLNRVTLSFLQNLNLKHFSTLLVLTTTKTGQSSEILPKNVMLIVRTNFRSDDFRNENYEIRNLIRMMNIQRKYTGIQEL